MNANCGPICVNCRMDRYARIANRCAQIVAEKKGLCFISERAMAGHFLLVKGTLWNYKILLGHFKGTKATTRGAFVASMKYQAWKIIKFCINLVASLPQSMWQNYWQPSVGGNIFILLPWEKTSSQIFLAGYYMTLVLCQVCINLNWIKRLSRHLDLDNDLQRKLIVKY